VSESERKSGANDEDDFAAMFEASLKAKRFEKGQTIEGTVVAIGPEVVFVDVGGKGEASIEVAEFKDADGQLEVAVGDRIHAVVVSTAGGLTLSRKLARGAATLRQLEEALHSGLAVEGKVEREVKGGYEVTIARQRAFCPFSQIDLQRSEPAMHIGRVYEFRVTEFREGGRSIVVSRRALLEEQQKERAEEVRRSIVEGAVLTGRVASVRDFGAFIDLGGGVQGLLHVSEMGWSRVEDPSATLKAGDEVAVKVLRLDEDKQKISLGMKQLQEDPWLRAASTYQPGQVVTGRVTRLADFGAFVELEPGVEGLAHASSFVPTGKSRGWSSQVAAGTTGAFEILSVDPGKKRIGLALLPEGSARAGTARPAAADIVPGARLTGTVERHEKFGVFVFLAPGRTGLIPMSETGLTNEGDLGKVFPIGGQVTVIVLDVDAESRRIRLSAKAVRDAQEAAELREYTERESATPSQGFGSLADKLRGALNPREK
jgi:small subunit ribosomal protein S1